MCAQTHTNTPELTPGTVPESIPERGQTWAGARPKVFHPQGSDLRIANGQKAIRKRAWRGGLERFNDTLGKFASGENCWKLCWVLEGNFVFLWKSFVQISHF